MSSSLSQRLRYVYQGSSNVLRARPDSRLALPRLHLVLAQSLPWRLPPNNYFLLIMPSYLLFEPLIARSRLVLEQAKVSRLWMFIGREGDPCSHARPTANIHAPASHTVASGSLQVRSGAKFSGRSGSILPMIIIIIITRIPSPILPPPPTFVFTVLLRSFFRDLSIV